MATKKFLLVGLMLLAASGQAHATAEICGNGVDDDGNGMVDEGCYPTLTTGVCESPLSCGDTGMVSWSTGSLHYDLPADIAPRVPYGSGIGFRRFYTSMYAPPSGGIPNINSKPMGEHWQHTYMTWVTPGATNQLMLHTSQGRDVLFIKSGSPVGGWQSYAPQAGYHVLSFKQNTVSPFQVQIQLLTGETITYNSSGQLTTITDLVGNAVAVASDGSGGTSTVTDASGKRRLLFGYTSGLLTTVAFQLNVSGTWTTEHTTTLAYTTGVLTTATIGGQLAQHYLYTGGYLTSMRDGGDRLVAGFSYSASTSGQVNRVDTGRGSIGFDYGSTRTGCPTGGGTLLAFNKANATVCNADSDCGTGNLCGGKTSTGATGACYAAARCLTISTANGESVVTATAPVGVGGKTCSGACADVLAYVWSSTSGLLNTLGVEDASNRFTSATYNANGLPTTIVEADDDSDATNLSPKGARATYILYDTTFPGRITELRRASDLDTNASSCSSSSSTGCARTLYTYNASAPFLLHTLASSGTTLNTSASNTPFTYTTTYTQDSVGRTTEIDGPLSGAKTIYDYYSSTDPMKNGFLQDIKRYVTATAYLQQSIFSYDLFGNPTGTTGVDSNVRCDSYDSSRDFLTQTRHAMAGQTDCTTPNSADLTTNWLRDSALRLTELQRPDGSCVLDSYDSQGRLSQVKRRDDCVAGSTGDYEQYVYSSDGQVLEVDTYDTSASIARKRLYSYKNGRQLSQVINPVNATYFTGFTYDASGKLTQIDDAGGLGETTYAYGPGADTRVLNETRYNGSMGVGSDSWSFAYAFDGDQGSYTDGDSKTTSSTRDDLGRDVKQATPDIPSGVNPVFLLRVYDAAGNVTTKVDAYNSSAALTSSYTYDYLNRRLSVTYSGTGSNVCNTNAFTQWSYDALPSGVTCPSGMTCSNLPGRLTYVTTSLLCSGSYGDNSLDQQTFYAFDANGRTSREHITDDSGRIADHQYGYTKNGALSQVTLPSSAVLGWSFGSTGNNSDTDRVTSIYRTSTSTPVADSVSWYPFGPLKQYNHENVSSFGTAERTRISRNLAYRVTDIRTETQDAAHELFGVALTEDVKGRVTVRDYADNSYGVQDSYFIYDNEDHLACETTTFASSCPTTAGATIKNSHYLSPPFTHAGDWKNLLRPIPGNTAMENDFSLTPGTHQVATVNQAGSLGNINFSYNAQGNRSGEYSAGLSHSARTYTYDARGDVTNIRGQKYAGVYPLGSWYYYDVASAFDAQGRRVFKSFYNETSLKTSEWFFYYDIADRLSEIRYIPDISASTTYSVFQLSWLSGRLVGYWETDYPSATTSRIYTGTDEAGRLIDAMTWPSSGSATRIWAVNPDAWGVDSNVVGGNSILLPLMFPGQYPDPETIVYLDNGSTRHRPGLVLNGFRTYDPFTGGYLQIDHIVPVTRSSYLYAGSDPVGKLDPTGLLTCESPEGCTDPYGGDTTYSDGGGVVSVGNGICTAGCAALCGLVGGNDIGDWCQCRMCGKRSAGGCYPGWQDGVCGCIPPGAICEGDNLWGGGCVQSPNEQACWRYVQSCHAEASKGEEYHYEAEIACLQSLRGGFNQVCDEIHSGNPCSTSDQGPAWCNNVNPACEALLGLGVDCDTPSCHQLVLENNGLGVGPGNLGGTLQ